jgi:hypothetical protein
MFEWDAEAEQIVQWEDELVECENQIGEGEIGFDRAYFLTRLAEPGLSEPELRQLAESHSLGKLYGLWEIRRRVSSKDSQTLFSDRYLVIQPSFDQSAHRFWGLAVGPDGEIIANALHQRETELPVLEGQSNGPDGRNPRC